jgi:hypothetical protein
VKAALGLLLLLPLACDRHGSGTPPGATVSARPSGALQDGPAPVKSGVTPFPEDPEAEPTPLHLGPSAENASPSERQERLVALLRGQIAAERLPLTPTEAGVDFDREQFQQLTTELVVGTKVPGRRGGAVVGPHRVLSGDLEGQPLERVLGAMRAGFRHCYNKALSLEPKLAGKLVVHAEVQRSGAMGKVIVVSGPPRSVELKRCVVARVQASQLGPLEKGDSAQLEIPITFAIEGGK